MKLASYICSIFFFICLAYSCKDDEGKILNYSVYNSSSGIALSRDTIYFDTIPSLFLSATQEVKVYNTNNHPISISKITLRNSNKSYQINIDGRDTLPLENIYIPAKDSIIIFARAFYDETIADKAELVEDSLIISSNNENMAIRLIGYRQNVVRISSRIYNNNYIINYNKPLFLTDSIIVNTSSTLTINEGTKIYMAPNAYIRVKGSLKINGTSSKPVYISSIRKDDIIPNISYSLIPGQFRGIIFSDTSKDNYIDYLRMTNGQFGLYFENSKIRDNNTNTLIIKHSKISNFAGEGMRLSSGIYNIEDCEISNTLAPCLSLNAGRYDIVRSSIVNLYSWESLRLDKALVYNSNKNTFKDSYLKMKYCVVDGSIPLYYDKDNNEYRNGEVELNVNASAKVNINNCYISLPSYTSKSIIINNILRPQDTIIPLSKVFYAIGLGVDNKKNYIYNYSPLPTAPFANLCKGSAPVDLDGNPRGNVWAYGCYVVRDKKK